LSRQGVLPTLRGVKIYTRTGDDGTTGVLGSERLLKSSLRVEAYGQVDELNAALGAVRAHDAQRWLHAEIDSVQRLLFNVGAELATLSAEALSRLPRVGDDDVAGLERAIDRLEADLPPLRNFVLPQGSPLAAELHVARAVCRRAERHVVALAQTEKVEPRLIRFLNRLADLLFVMARWCNRRAGIADTEWKAR
jgi:cob(I)alamin adenosyltransferase